MFVPELHAYVVAQVPQAEALGGICPAAALNALLAALVGGGFCLFAIFLVSRAIAAPVMRAARLLRDIVGGGDLTHRMPPLLTG